MSNFPPFLIQLEAEKNKLENLLNNNLYRRKDELEAVSIAHFYFQFFIILQQDQQIIFTIINY